MPADPRHPAPTAHRQALLWALACGLLLVTKRHAPRRLAMGLAAAVMLAVYLVPHSARGSEPDYTRLDQGLDPSKAVVTGR